MWFFLFFQLKGPPGPPGPPGSSAGSSSSRHHDREEDEETPYFSASSWNMRIVPGAVTFPNIDEMTKVCGHENIHYFFHLFLLTVKNICMLLNRMATDRIVFFWKFR